MCGIVGYIGPRDATPIILNGLKRLEYRGYDSAGIAVLNSEGQVELRREVGKLDRLQKMVEESPLSGNLGIGHTRWATHGVPSRHNAHPHLSERGSVVIVHNGIVENFLTLRDELAAEGVSFRSETDSEVIAHMVERFYEPTEGLAEAVRRALLLLEGSNAIVLFSASEPDKIIAARLGNAGGIAIGFGEGEMFVASDLPAILEHTRRVAFLNPGEMAVVSREGVEIFSLDGERLTVEPQVVPWDPVAAEKGQYRHFMQKEIHEQTRALTDTIAGRVDFESGKIHLDTLNLTPDLARRIRKIFITACGTAYHAGLVGKTLIERIARIPEFVKGQVLQSIEGNAKKWGFDRVTDEVLDRVIKKWIDTGDFHESEYGYK